MAYVRARIVCRLWSCYERPTKIQEMSTVTAESRPRFTLLNWKPTACSIVCGAALLLLPSVLSAQQFGNFAQRQTEQAMKSLSDESQKTIFVMWDLDFLTWVVLSLET